MSSNETICQAAIAKLDSMRKTYTKQNKIINLDRTILPTTVAMIEHSSFLLLVTMHISL